MIRKNLHLRLSATLLPLVLTASVASAASSLSNSLTGFTGNSTQPGTQAALAAAGFNFSDTRGFTEDPPGEFIDPTIQFDSSGATFGALIGVDGGRNYIRTAESDYANVSFVSEVTWVTSDLFNQAAYFGLGAGEPSAFRIPDWTSQFSTVQLFLEVNPSDPFINTLQNRNGLGEFVADAAPGLDSGTHRLRLAYDWFRKRAEFSIDINYSGGPFVADVSATAVDVLSLYGADGWANEPARIYVGGDDGVVFKDFQVTVSTASMRLGDFNMDGSVTSADWGILRTNQHTNLSGNTFAEAYFLGDVTADLANNHADFVAFKALYEEANGVGSFAAMLNSVPEASTGFLAMSAAILLLPAVRRAKIHTQR